MEERDRERRRYQNPSPWIPLPALRGEGIMDD